MNFLADPWSTESQDSSQYMLGSDVREEKIAGRYIFISGMAQTGGKEV